MAQAPRAPSPAVQAKKPTPAPRPRRQAPKAKAAAEPASEPLAPPKGVYLIGDELKSAGAVAEHEWGWKPTKTGWRDGGGQDVQWLPDFKALKAACAENPILLYRGYRWYAAIPSHFVDQLIAAKRVLVLPDPDAQPIV